MQENHYLDKKHRIRIALHALRPTLVWLAAILLVVAFIPACEAPPKPGNILVVQFGNAEMGGDGKLFRVDPANGTRSVLSNFANAAQGAVGARPFGVEVEPTGPILVMDANAGTGSKGALFRIDAASGARTVLSDFGNPSQGPEGVARDIPLPFIDVAVESSGNILVTAIDTGMDKKGALFRVDAKTGARRILSDFGDTAQGPLGQNPVGVTVVKEQK